MVEPLIAIAAAGGTALVGAVATDAWQAVRDGVVRLFSRAGQRRADAAGHWADETSSDLRGVAPADRSVAEQMWMGVWRQRLHDLAQEYPELGDELRAWVRSVHLALPAERRAWVNTFVARDQAQQYNAPGGSITVHHARDGAPPQ